MDTMTENSIRQAIRRWEKKLRVQDSINAWGLGDVSHLHNETHQTMRWKIRLGSHVGSNSRTGGFIVYYVLDGETNKPVAKVYHHVPNKFHYGVWGWYFDEGADFDGW